MVQQLRGLMGRVDVRVLVFLALGALIAGLAVSVAELAKASESDPSAVSSWDDILLKYFQFRDHNYPLIVPSPYLQSAEIEVVLKDIGVGGLQKEPDWYWNFDGGVFYFDNKSSLAKQVEDGAEIVIYEDMVSREILVLRAPQKEGEEYVEELSCRSPSWPEVPKDEDYGAYLVRELSKRRVAWQVRLLSRELTDAEELALAAVKAPALMKDSGEGGSLLLRFGDDFTNHLWTSIDGPNDGLTNVEIGVHVPEAFTNRLEVFAITNLLSFPWSVVETNLLAEGTDVVYWADSEQDALETRFYAVGNADVDTDEDGVRDVRETFVHGTDPSQWDTDDDGASDGDELAANTDPLNDPGDSDGDGLSDDLEVVLGTNPDGADSDLDWASDRYEWTEGTDPLDPYSTPPLGILCRH